MLSVGGAYAIILVCCAVGLVYGLINYLRVRTVDLKKYSSNPEGYTKLEEHHDHEHGPEHGPELSKEQVDLMLEIGEYISTVTVLAIILY